MKIRKNGAGFTLIELLVAITIIGIISMFAIASFGNSQQKARDAQRKNDLTQLATALEHYYNDNEKYVPNAANLENELAPYLQRGFIPKDPTTDVSYYYCPIDSGDGFRLYAKLENCKDSAVTDKENCETGEFNYTVTSSDLTPITYSVLFAQPESCGQIAGPTSFPSTPTLTPAPPTSTPVPTPTLQPPVEFVATADTYIGGEWPNSNFGGASNLDVMSYLSWSRRTYVRFNLSSIPAGSTINSATLSLYIYELPATNRTYFALRSIFSWEENTLNWNNQSGETPPLSSASTPSVTGFMNWDVIPTVQSWVDGASSNNGFIIRDSTEGNSSPLLSRFRSREWTTGSQRPKLVVIYTLP